MSIDAFPKYLVLKCLNKEELNTVEKLNFALPSAQVKVTTDLSELAKDESFIQVVSSDVEDNSDHNSSDEISNTSEDSEDDSRSMDEESSNENETTGPDPKKSKLTFEVFHYSTDENKSHDRILMLKNVKFYIQSVKLIKHSNYFRSLFTCDFKEKEQEVITIKVFDAQKMKMFMDAVYTPNFEFTEGNLSIVVELFGFFEAVTYLIELFKEKQVIESIAADELLDYADKFALNELKTAIEEFLIEKMNVKYINLSPRPKRALNIRKQYMKFEEPAESSLKIAEKYNLKNLQDVIDAHLAFEFTRNVPAATGHLPYVTLPNKYSLVQLTKAVENYAISIVGKNTEDVIETYLSDRPKAKIEMVELKRAAGHALLQQFNNNKPTSLSSYKEYLNMSNKCYAMELKKKISDYLEKILEAKDGSFSFSHRDARSLAFDYDIEPVKSRQEELVIAKFLEDPENGYECDYVSSAELPKLKEVVEVHLMRKFTDSEKDDDFIYGLCANSKDWKMEKLKKDKMELKELTFTKSETSYESDYSADEDEVTTITVEALSTSDKTYSFNHLNEIEEETDKIEKVLEKTSFVDNLQIYIPHSSSKVFSVLMNTKAKIRGIWIKSLFHVTAEEIKKLCQKFKVTFLVLDLDGGMFNDDVLTAILPKSTLCKDNNRLVGSAISPLCFTDRTLSSLVGEHGVPRSFSIYEVHNMFTVEKIVETIKTIMNRDGPYVFWNLGILQPDQTNVAFRYFGENGEMVGKCGILIKHMRGRLYITAFSEDIPERNFRITFAVHFS